MGCLASLALHFPDFPIRSTHPNSKFPRLLQPRLPHVFKARRHPAAAQSPIPRRHRPVFPTSPPNPRRPPPHPPVRRPRPVMNHRRMAGHAPVRLARCREQRGHEFTHRIPNPNPLKIRHANAPVLAPPASRRMRKRQNRHKRRRPSFHQSRKTLRRRMQIPAQIVMTAEYVPRRATAPHDFQFDPRPPKLTGDSRTNDRRNSLSRHLFTCHLSTVLRSCHVQHPIRLQPR